MKAFRSLDDWKEKQPPELGKAEKKKTDIAFFKLMYYYQLRYFDGEFDHILESELSNINLKLNGQPKFAKSEVIKQLRASRIPQEKIK